MNFQNRKYPLLLIAVLIIALSSCQKRETIEVRLCPEDESYEAALEWCYFDVGTWWVYEEENTGVRDSIYVYYAMNWGPKTETFEYFSHSAYDGFDYRYYMYESWESTSNVEFCIVRRLYRAKTQPGNPIGYGVIANFPPLLYDFQVI